MDKLLKVAVITWAAFLVLLAGMLLTTNRQEAGMEYLGSLIERYGDLSAALCSYHDGHDTGRRGYSNAVLEAAEKWQ